MSLKNITITLPEDVAKWARVWAAENETSLSRMLGLLLREQMLEEQTYDAAMRSFLAKNPGELKERGRYPGREALHDRDRLR